MKLNSFFLVAAVAAFGIQTSFAQTDATAPAAPSCLSLAGKYQVKGDDGSVAIASIEQVDCKVMNISDVDATGAVTATVSWTLDGTAQPYGSDSCVGTMTGTMGPNSTDILVKMDCSTPFGDMGVSVTQKWTLNADGNLSIESITDIEGNVETSSMVAIRMP